MNVLFLIALKTDFAFAYVFLQVYLLTTSVKISNGFFKKKVSYLSFMNIMGKLESLLFSVIIFN